MKPLFVLLGVFLISLFILQLSSGKYDYLLSVRIAMAAMLVFTAIGHFAFTKGMTMMLPPFIPCKKEIVYATGIFEILAAIGLLIGDTKTLAAWSLILFFILVLPANINAAVRHIDYQKGTSEGNGTRYLLFRVPLQILFISLAYLIAVS